MSLEKKEHFSRILVPRENLVTRGNLQGGHRGAKRIALLTVKA